MASHTTRLYALAETGSTNAETHNKKEKQDNKMKWNFAKMGNVRICPSFFLHCVYCALWSRTQKILFTRIASSSLRTNLKEKKKAIGRLQVVSYARSGTFMVRRFLLPSFIHRLDCVLTMMMMTKTMATLLTAFYTERQCYLQHHSWACAKFVLSTKMTALSKFPQNTETNKQTHKIYR